MSKELSLSDRLALAVNEDGDGFKLNLLTNAGNVYAALEANSVSSELNNLLPNTIFDFKIHTRSRAKKGEYGVRYENCEALGGQTCRFEVGSVTVENPVVAIDEGIQVMQRKFPSFFKSVRIPSGEVVAE